MPHVIAVGRRTPSGYLARLCESLLARWGWVTGRIPVGVTPTVRGHRWWH